MQPLPLSSTIPSGCVSAGEWLKLLASKPEELETWFPIGGVLVLSGFPL